MPIEDWDGDDRPTGKIIDFLWEDNQGSLPIVWLPNPGATPDCNLPAGERGIILDDGFTMQETGPATGIFTGSLIIPRYSCDGTSVVMLAGTYTEVTYHDWDDGGDNSVEQYGTFDITSYNISISKTSGPHPVMFYHPYGTVQEFGGSVHLLHDSHVYSATYDGDQSNCCYVGNIIFPISPFAIFSDPHQATRTGAIDTEEETVGDGTMKFYWEINDPNYNIHPNEIDSIATTAFGEYGPVIISVMQNTNIIIPSTIDDENILATAGGPTVAVEGKKITLGSTPNVNTRQLGPIYETGPDTGIFRFSLDIKHTDGFGHSDCPETMYYSFDGTLSSNKSSRFDIPSTDTLDYCIILPSNNDNGRYSVASINAVYKGIGYTGTTDTMLSSSWPVEPMIEMGSVLYSATDHEIIVSGQEMVITLNHPYLNRDMLAVETATMDLINLECAYGGPKFAMGPLGLAKAGITGNPFNLSVLTETGADTGSFQGTITIPSSISGIELFPQQDCMLAYYYWNGFTSDTRIGTSGFAIVHDIPVATTPNTTVNEDASTDITLSGTDLSGDVLSYSVLTQPTHGTLTGTAPNLSYTPNANFNGADSFTYKISDGIFDSTSTLSITVFAINDIPVANAGSDQSVNPGSVVQLDGSQSSDVDGDTITYSWIQTAGYPVTLTAENIASPQFTAPSQGGQLTFMLTLNDGTATSSPNVVNIYVGQLIPDPTPPPAPGSVASSASNSQVTLTWSPPSDDGGAAITDYLVEYATADSSTWLTYNDGTSAATSATITGLSNGQEYNFRISAVNSAGIGDASGSVDATPSVEPEVEPEVEPVEPVEPVEQEITPEPEPVIDLEPDAESEMTSEAVPAFEPEPKSEAAQTSAGCGAGTVMVNGVCQLTKTSGTSMAIEPIYIVIAAVAIGGGVVGALFALKRGSGTPKPAREEIEEYESKYVARKPAEKKETSSSCSNCGKPLKPTAKFCGECGTPRS
jgi:hypothetical protein